MLNAVDLEDRAGERLQVGLLGVNEDRATVGVDEGQEVVLGNEALVVVRHDNGVELRIELRRVNFVGLALRVLIHAHKLGHTILGIEARLLGIGLRREVDGNVAEGAKVLGHVGRHAG